MSQTSDTPTVPGYRAGTWKADPDRSTIGFAIRQVATKARGRFTGYDVTVVTCDDLLDSSVSATIDLASVDTGNDKRDKHLRGPDLLKAGEYPTMNYHSTGIRRTPDGWIVDGELTVLGTTRSLPLALEVNGFGVGQATFTATGQLSRRDFGISIPMAGGGVVIADKISITLEIHAVRQ